ncbi:lysine transporter LysE [Marmoricola endophyticus]|uniref:Lysine transporter LysE n=1 Tax=Marmoricola endophyticus TaxID=2040280 RepID=A0A917BQH5_9ACTN|nr:LysE family translocator [Marmoricola endophyticus]GGF52709.1 lysine transporter LysE [Marmoricola endophyticus]
MTSYLTFVALATLLAVAPGPDSFLTLRATLVSGRRRGLLTCAGIAAANTVQGALAATGLGAVLEQSETLFAVIRWAGVAYLTWIGVQALRTALSRDLTPISLAGPRRGRGTWQAVRQGFLCNITNPKVLAFNLAVLPQFVGAGAGWPLLMTYALTLMVVGAVVLLGIIWLAGYAADALARPRVRRSVEGVAGTAMLGFAVGLAAEA